MATTGIDRVATLTNEGRADTGTHDVLHEKMADVPDERPIDYEKMEHQAIGVTRIETLWRHFGTNRVVLTSLACTIFREWQGQRSSDQSGVLRVHPGRKHDRLVRSRRRVVL
jgi:hypothetical protein